MNFDTLRGRLLIQIQIHITRDQALESFRAAVPGPFDGIEHSCRCVVHMGQESGSEGMRWLVSWHQVSKHTWEC